MKWFSVIVWTSLAAQISSSWHKSPLFQSIQQVQIKSSQFASLDSLHLFSSSADSLRAGHGGTCCSLWNEWSVKMAQFYGCVYHQWSGEEEKGGKEDRGGLFLSPLSLWKGHLRLLLGPALTRCEWFYTKLIELIIIFMFWLRLYVEKFRGSLFWFSPLQLEKDFPLLFLEEIGGNSSQVRTRTNIGMTLLPLLSQVSSSR